MTDTNVFIEINNYLNIQYNPNILITYDNTQQIEESFDMLKDYIAEYVQNEQTDSDLLFRIIQFVYYIINSQLQAGTTFYQFIQQFNKNLQQSKILHLQIEQVLAFEGLDQQQSNIQNPQLTISFCVVKMLIIKNQMFQFLTEMKQIVKQFDKLLIPSSIFKNQTYLTQLTDIFEHQQFECKDTYFHYQLLFCLDQQYQEMLQQAVELFNQLPNECLIFSFDKQLINLIVYMQQLLNNQDIQTETKILFDFQQVLETILKGKAIFNAEIASLLNLNNMDMIAGVSRGVEALITVLNQAGEKIKQFQKTGFLNFGAVQIKLLFYRFLLSEPQILVLLLAGLAGFLEEKPMLHLYINKYYKDFDTPIKCSKFCAQLCIISQKLLLNKHILNLHNMSAISQLNYNDIIQLCLTNAEDGFNVILFKTFNLANENTQQFNIVNYYKLAVIIQQIYNSSTKQKQQSFKNILQIINPYTNDFINIIKRIQTEIQQRQISEDEYQYIFIFKLLCQNQLHNIFDYNQLNNSNINNNSILSNHECCDYIKRQIEIMQISFSRNINNSQCYQDTAFIQKERMGVAILAIFEEQQNIKNANIDLVIGSFTSKLFDKIEKNQKIISQVLNNDENLIHAVINEICVYMNNYKSNPHGIEYKQLSYYDNSSISSHIQELGQLYQQKIATVQQLLRLVQLFTNTVEYGCIKNCFQTLIDILTNQEKCEVLREIVGNFVRNTQIENQTTCKLIQELLKCNKISDLFTLIKQTRHSLIRKYNLDAFILNKKILDYMLQIMENIQIDIDTNLFDQVNEQSQVKQKENEKEKRVKKEIVHKTKNEHIKQFELSSDSDETQSDQESVEQQDEEYSSSVSIDELGLNELDTPQQKSHMSQLTNNSNEDTFKQSPQQIEICKSIINTNFSHLRQSMIEQYLKNDVTDIVSNIVSEVEKYREGSVKKMVSFSEDDDDDNDPSQHNVIVVQKPQDNQQGTENADNKGNTNKKQKQIKRQRTRLDLDIPLHQMFHYTYNTLPFVNNNIVLEQVQVDVDLIQQAEIQITHSISDYYSMPDQEYSATLEKELYFKQQPEHLQPLTIKGRMAKFKEDWSEHLFYENLDNMFSYVQRVDKDFQQTLRGAARWEDVLASTSVNTTNCYTCGKWLDFSNTQSQKEEISGDLSVTNQHTAIFCQFYGRWLCGNCSGGHGGFQSIHHSQLDGSTYVFSANALSQLYKFWNCRLINIKQLIGPLKSNIIEAKLLKNVFMHLQPIINNCSVTQQLFRSLDCPTGLFERNWSFQEYSSLIFNNNVFCYQIHILQEYNELIKKHQKLLNKYQEKSFFREIQPYQLGNIVDQYTFIINFLFLHLSKCQQCSSTFFVCSECQKEMQHDLNFEFIIKYVCELSCRFCLKPTHQKCHPQHKCKKNQLSD